MLENGFLLSITETEITRITTHTRSHKNIAATQGLNNLRIDQQHEDKMFGSVHILAIMSCSIYLYSKCVPCVELPLVLAKLPTASLIETFTTTATTEPN